MTHCVTWVLLTHIKVMTDRVCVCCAVESVGGSRRGTPAPPMPAAAALAAHLKQGVPQAQYGGLLGVFASHDTQVSLYT